MKLEHEFSKILEFENIFQGPRFEKLKRSLMSIMLRQKDILFQQSQDPGGKAWEPIGKASARKKIAKNTRSIGEIESLKQKNKNYSDHKILVDTGLLKNSLTSANAPYEVKSTAGNEVSLGTNVPYAAIHNFGGTIHNPGTDNGFGLGIEIKPYTIEMPQREFIGFGEQDNQQVTEKVQSYMRKGG